MVLSGTSFRLRFSCGAWIAFKFSLSLLCALNNNCIKFQCFNPSNGWARWLQVSVTAILPWQLQLFVCWSIHLVVWCSAPLVLDSNFFLLLWESICSIKISPLFYHQLWWPSCWVSGNAILLDPLCTQFTLSNSNSRDLGSRIRRTQILQMLMCLQMINVHPITTGGATGESSADVLHLQGILSSSSSKKATVRPVNKDESRIKKTNHSRIKKILVVKWFLNPGYDAFKNWRKRTSSFLLEPQDVDNRLSYSTETQLNNIIVHHGWLEVQYRKPS